MRAGKPIIGLAGGIGAGKSTVASILQDLGARVIDSDRLNHDELNSPEVQAELCQWWGERIVKPDGSTDRGVIRSIVTADPQARRRLEELVHPRIARRRDAMMAEWANDPAVLAVVWDSPLLFEAGLAEACDKVIYVDADPAARRARVMGARSWSEEDMLRLEKSQYSLDFKRNSADYTVVNNSDIDDLRRQLIDVFSRILSGA